MMSQVPGINSISQKIDNNAKSGAISQEQAKQQKAQFITEAASSSKVV